MDNINIPAILNFGFIGLSFLMVLLGYKLTSEVVKKESISEERVVVTKFFLKIALVFMLLAGPLQWITLAVSDYTEEDSVVLYVGASNLSWKENYGEIYFSRKGELTPISKKMAKLEFSDEEEVRIELFKVIGAFNKMQASITALNEKLSRDTPEAIEAVAGG